MTALYNGKIKSFFFGQYFGSGLRTAFGILFPAVVFSWLDNAVIGITLSLGALTVAITDIPGPFFHKRNGMLITILFIFLAALITGLLNSYTWLLAVEIPLLCFFFAMLAVYGVRASLAGTASLLIMIITTGQNHLVSNPWMQALYIAAGGAWYTLLSLSLSQIRPYRLAQQAIGESILTISDYLRIRARFYDDKTPVEDNYKELVKQQVKVNQELDNIREIVLKSRRMVNEPSGAGKLLVILLTDIIDLFEYAMSIPYDYNTMRKHYAEYHILPEVSRLVQKFSAAFDSLGYSLINNERPKLTADLNKDLEDLKLRIDELEEQNVSVFALKKVLINLRDLIQRLEGLYSSFKDRKRDLPEERKSELHRFVSHQNLDWRLLLDNLTLDSITFRHALRLAVACFFGYLVAIYLSLGQHSYWILITILVILKPAYVLTKQRNLERVIGTIAGGLIGIGILVFIEDPLVKFFMLVIFMVLTFTFLRLKYIVGVFFMTPFILIAFSFLSKSNGIQVAEERILDTLIGSFIALLANYFVFPKWESQQITPLLSGLTSANLHYFQQVVRRLNADNFSITDYKLSRKEVYVQTANLATAFQNMLNEPKNQQKDIHTTYQLIVLNHILSSYLANLSASIEDLNTSIGDPEFCKTLRKSMKALHCANRNFGGESKQSEVLIERMERPVEYNTPEVVLVKEQLDLVYKTALDIEKLSEKFN